jgi:hypothetical protein
MNLIGDFRVEIFREAFGGCDGVPQVGFTMRGAARKHCEAAPHS